MTQPRTVVEKIVGATGDLPTMPHVASLVMEKLSDPNATPKDLHKIISQDQALAARVLKIANSPFYGCARTVTNLTDALVVMGFDSIRSLVVASAMHDFFKKFGLAEKLLWEHSIGCGSIAKQVARRAKYSKIEEAFLAGLLHDIGKVVLNLKMPDEMLKIVQNVYNNSSQSFLELEEKAFGFNHAQVGMLIARKWNFTDTIEEAIGCHHNPEEAKIMPVLSYVISLSNSICHKLEIGPTRKPDLDLSELREAKALKLTPETLIDLLSDVSEGLKSEGGGIRF
jgi:putative nucleotidyltransferase with HDIG domain